MEKKDVIDVLWVDIKSRQEHYWASFNRFSLAIIMVNIAPFLKPDIIEKLDSLILVFPVLGFFMAAIGCWYLGGEYQRLRMLRSAHETLMREFVEIPRMPLVTLWDRIVEKPIGPLASGIFGIGLTLISVINAVLLWTRFRN